MHKQFWVTKQAGQEFPTTAFRAGYHRDRSDMFIGRAIHENNLLPGTVVPSKDACLIGYEGSEVMKTEFEVLCGDHLRWLSPSEVILKRAVQGGYNADGEPIYIGRVAVRDEDIIGKVYPSLKVCFVSYYGVQTCYPDYDILTAEGYYWIPNPGKLAFPTAAFRAGFMFGDNEYIYIGRAVHENNLLPGQIERSKDTCVVGCDGLELFKKDYEIMCGDNLRWVSSSKGHIPRGSVQGGKTADGETLYIGRVHYHEEQMIGKVEVSKKGCLFPFRSKEIYYKNYEILIGSEAHYWANNMESAFIAGEGTDGGKIYIGRIEYMNDLLPAMIDQNAGKAFISYDGQGHKIPIGDATRKVLCGNDMKWVAASEGQVPPKSVIGGKTSLGENLYIGRVDYLGSTYIGKVQPSNRCCYIPYDSEEISFENYEILVDE